MEKERDKKIKAFTSRMQARLLLVFCVITVLLVALIGRLIYIMNRDGERYAKQVLSRQSYVSAVLPYKRGDIMDRNGTVLARSELQFRLILDPKNLLINSEYIEATANALKVNFDIDPSEISRILEEKPESQYVILRKNLKLDEVNQFKELMSKNNNIKSLWFEEEYVRSYPFETLACDIIGFTSADNVGFYGIEEYYNDLLNGTNGREYGYYDSSLNIERIVKKPENGHSIVTTIDSNVQRILQRHIKDFNAEIGSLNIGILVMNPNNGEILGMASNQEYNLNDPRNLEVLYTAAEIASMTSEQKVEALNKLWKNDAISYGYEPGSTFKPFTVASALEEAIVSEGSSFYCDGVEHIGGFDISCNKRTGHGNISLGEALMKSCNDALMQIAALEGKNIFYPYQSFFGFGQKTGVDLPGEESGILATNKDATDLATNSFGQNFNVTMLQMAAGYSSLVNGGYYYQPHIVKKIINDAGATVKQIDKTLIRQTVSEETSEFIQKYMYQTVELGTAKPAKVPGYAVGGKTGTAEKYPRENDTYLVSFLGAVPAINPEVVIYIIVDEPQNVERQDDSSIATKLASKVLAEILPALGIYPEGEIDYLLPDPEDIPEGEDASGQEGDTGTDNQTPAGSTEGGNGQNGNSSGGAGNTTGDNNTADGNTAGGNSTGGNSTGGNTTGGNTSGGQNAAGGANTGGRNTTGGGNTTGGDNTTGGANTGGGNTTGGGNSTGGDNSTGEEPQTTEPPSSGGNLNENPDESEEEEFTGAAIGPINE